MLIAVFVNLVSVSKVDGNKTLEGTTKNRKQGRIRDFKLGGREISSQSGPEAKLR